MKRILIVAVLSLFVLSACNTWHGFGKDVEHVGDKISNSGK